MKQFRFHLLMFMVLIICIFCLPGLRPAGAAPPGSEEGGQKGYELRFQGNGSLSRKKLSQAAQSELDDFVKEGYQRADIDDAAFQMRLAYRRQGFAFGEVDYEYQIRDDRVIVTFRISEGPQVMLGDIIFEGVNVFAKETLLAFFDLEKKGLLAKGEKVFIESEIEEGISEIRDYYLEKGYQDVEIREPDIDFSENRSLATVRIRLREGPRYYIKKVLFKGDVYPETGADLDRIARELRGRFYSSLRDLELRSQVLEVYGNNGYPEADIELTTTEGQPGDIHLRAKIESGPKVWIEEVEVRGNRKTIDSFVRSRLQMQGGDLYRVRERRRSFRDLYGTGLFSRLDISLEKGEDINHRILLIEVEESLSQEVSFEVGWGSYELLRGKVGYREKNLMGAGRIFRTELGASFKHREFQVGITDPWFLGSGISADLPFFYRQREEPSFTRTEFETSLVFSKRLSPNTTTSLGYNYRITEISDVALDETIEDLDDNYNLGSIKLQLTYDTRNDLFFPTSGQRYFISGEIADSTLGSEIYFSRFTTGLRRFFPLTGQLVLGLRYSTGLLLPTRDQDNIPLGERYFNGGENTVRSFRQDQLGPFDMEGEAVGGLAFNVLSAEFRYLISGPFIGTLFFDYGNISPNQSHNAPEDSLFGTDRSELTSATFRDYFQDFRPAVGFGLQYMLPVGPARLDFAFNPDAGEKERDYTIHFSVGQAF